MRVTLAKHGGQAAGIYLNRPSRVLNTDSLPPTEAGELQRLLSAVGATSSDEAARFSRRPDEMSYTITVEGDGRQSTFTQSDITMTPAFDALLRWLEGHLAGK